MDKCAITGKVRFNRISEARDAIASIRRNCKRTWNGRRRKHRQGKPAQKRGYYCRHCEGYHLTSWEKHTKRKTNEHVPPDMIAIIRR